MAETGESLDRLDADLVALEQGPGDEALIANIFRVLHTIKGASGFLGLPRLGAVAHRGEAVLGHSDAFAPIEGHHGVLRLKG